MGSFWVFPGRIIFPGMVEGIVELADLDGDGIPDLACIGSATRNLKWYRTVKK